MASSRTIFITIASGLGLLLTYGCLDPYTAPAAGANVNYLVVEGFLDGAGGTTTIKLSRTAVLSLKDSIVSETLASVGIEAEDGSAFILRETSPGTYSASNLVAQPDKNYRLTIKTSAHKEYSSDFVPFKQTPVIDSIHWTIEDNNLHLYVDTHDDNNNTHYYLWKYAETWSYHSKYNSIIKWENNQVVPRSSTDDLFHCWKTVPSTRILIGSTARLIKDVVSDYLLEEMPLTSEKLQTEYSILVEQLALTKDAYEYWAQVMKNTENIGTIFGPQPSQVVSNVHCLTNPEEPVVGYFGACTMRQQRIYILNADLPSTRHDTGYERCEMDTLFLNQLQYYSGAAMLIAPLYVGPGLVGYLTSDDYCVDCRLRGGTTIKPAFWK